MSYNVVLAKLIQKKLKNYIRMGAPLIHSDHPHPFSRRWGLFWLRKWIKLGEGSQ